MTKLLDWLSLRVRIAITQHKEISNIIDIYYFLSTTQAALASEYEGKILSLKI